MSKKKSKKKKQQKARIIINVLMCLPFILTFTTLFIFGFLDKLILWLIALMSLAWFALGISALCVLPKKKWQDILINPHASYAGKPLSRKEALFFMYVYVVIILGLGVLSAIWFFREMFF